MNPAQFIVDHLGNLTGKLIILAIAAAVAYGVQRVLTRILRDALAKTNIPDASIFVNIVRGSVWLVAGLCILKPVFDISPNAFIASLGAASIAVSLGLQTTISNLVGGLTLMASKVVQPGDYITVNGITGEVVDVNWRDTTVRDRVGNTVVVPNSQLNSSSLTRLTSQLASQATLDVTFKPGCDLEQACQEVIARADKALGPVADPSNATRIVCTGTGSAGTKATLLFNVRPGTTFESAIDTVVRSLEGFEPLA